MKRMGLFFLILFSLFLQNLESQAVSCLSFVEDIALETQDILYTPLFMNFWQKLRDDFVGEKTLHFSQNVQHEEFFNGLSDLSSLFPPSAHLVGLFYPYRHKNPLEALKKKVQNKISYRLSDFDGTHSLGLIDTWAYMVLSKTIFLSCDGAFSSKEMKFFSEEKESPLFVKSCFLNVTENNKKEVSRHISVVYYSNPNDFFLKISFSEASEELFLVKMPKIFSFKKSVETILSFGAVEKKTTALKVGDMVVFPEIFVEKRYVHREIEDNPLKNASKEGFFFTDVFSECKIQISVNSQSAGVFQKNFVTQNIHQKRFLQKIARSYVFDKPFFVFLKLKKEKNPYCILWVKNNNFLKVHGQ